MADARTTKSKVTCHIGTREMLEEAREDALKRRAERYAENDRRIKRAGIVAFGLCIAFIAAVTLGIIPNG